MKEQITQKWCMNKIAPSPKLVREPNPKVDREVCNPQLQALD